MRVVVVLVVSSVETNAARTAPSAKALISVASMISRSVKPSSPRMAGRASGAGAFVTSSSPA